MSNFNTVNSYSYDSAETYELVHTIEGYGIHPHGSPLVAYFGSEMTPEYVRDAFGHWKRGERSSLYFTLQTIDEIVEQLDVATRPEMHPDVAALWALIGEEANNRGWCEEYDEFAEMHGGPVRPPRKVRPNLGFRLSLPVEMNEGDADDHDGSWTDAFNASGTGRERRARIVEAFAERVRYASGYYTGDEISEEQARSVARFLGDYLSSDAI